MTDIEARARAYAEKAWPQSCKNERKLCAADYFQGARAEVELVKDALRAKIKEWREDSTTDDPDWINLSWLQDFIEGI